MTPQRYTESDYQRLARDAGWEPLEIDGAWWRAFSEGDDPAAVQRDDDDPPDSGTIIVDSAKDACEFDRLA